MKDINNMLEHVNVFTWILNQLLEHVNVFTWILNQLCNTDVKVEEKDDTLFTFFLFSNDSKITIILNGK